MAKNFFEILDKNQQKLFEELTIKDGNKVIFNGLRSAGILIFKQIKSNFNTVKKGKSKTGYSDLKKSLRMEKMQSQFGVKIGFTKKGYKYRFINYGTDERITTGYGKSKKRSFSKKSNKGKLNPTKFFDNAVEQRRNEALSLVSQSIIKSLNNVIKKNGGN